LSWWSNGALFGRRSAAFRLLGYRVLEARSGVDALRILESEDRVPVHHVVTDV
jgi:hypothetical protein